MKPSSSSVGGGGGKSRLPSAAFTDDADALKEAIKSGNINISTDYMKLEDTLEREKKATLEELERRKRIRLMKVSTDDDEVKKDLRTLGEVICFFGEGPADRRQRLKEVLSRTGPEALLRREILEQLERPSVEKKQDESTWYHEGPESLKQARQWILEYSLKRAKQRLEDARYRRSLPDRVKIARRQDLQKKLQSITIASSQVGDARPISFIQFSPDGKLLATSSWSGLIKLWSAPDCTLKNTLKGHLNNVGCVVFHPQATISLEDTACCMASCGADGSVKLWNLVSDEPVADVPGHECRVSRIMYHPSGRFLATCCFDSSWRLWDLEQAEEVLHQEGHSKAVYCVAFQPDGSLAITGGMDAFGRIWDLRSGRCIMFLEGHLKSILGVDCSSNGFHVATGSEDNSCKIWDIRQRACIYTIPAHNNLISGVKFQPGEGNYITTSSYDQTAKLWLNGTWQPLKTLKGHAGRVMSVDISPDGQYIATSSFDRTFKLWTWEN